jgi:hypothetical protein
VSVVVVCCYYVSFSNEPAAMVSPSVAVPCRDGVSHHWDEYASQAQIEKGIRTLADALATLAGSCAADSETAPRAEQEDL